MRTNSWCMFGSFLGSWTPSLLAPGTGRDMEEGLWGECVEAAQEFSQPGDRTGFQAEAKLGWGGESRAGWGPVAGDEWSKGCPGWLGSDCKVLGALWPLSSGRREGGVSAVCRHSGPRY